MAERFSKESGLVSVVIALGVSVALVVTAFLLPKEPIESEGQDNVLIVTEEENRPVQITETDTDEDGLKDWEEALWKSNPENPDTDGDGTLDGDEIALNRSPVVSAPGDGLEQTPKILTQENESGTAQQDEPLSKTDIFTRQFFSRYLTLSQFGELDESDVEALVLAAKPFEVPDVEQYTLNDLGVIPYSEESTEDYKQSVVSILSQYDTNPVDEVTVLERFAQTGVVEDKKSLGEVAHRYKTMAGQLVALPTPIAVANEHLLLVNTLSRLGASVSYFAEAQTDPILALAAVKEYDSDIQFVQEIFTILQNSL